ncbi:MAG: ISAs1 family transposase [Actinomycetes bacterium]
MLAPSEATLRRMATTVDPEKVEAAVAAWTAAQLPDPPGGEMLAVAIDGKTVRGARNAGERAPHLLAAATHHCPVVLTQRQIPSKTNEIPMVATLVQDLRAAGHDPATMTFTLDALHTQHATAALLHQGGAGYVMTVKPNQPGLLAAIQNRLLTTPTARARARSHGHERTEERLLYAAAADGITFPGATQIFRIVRHTGGLDGQRSRKEIVHCITNLTPAQASPAQLAALIRGHWSIENSIHWVRDVTYREDASRVRTGNAPAVLAAIIGRLTGRPN